MQLVLGLLKGPDKGGGGEAMPRPGTSGEKKE